MGTGGLLDALPGPSSLHTLGTAAVYAVVFGFVFAECGLLVGFLLPGDTLLFTAGVVAAGPGRASVGWLVTGAVAAAVAGECLGFLVGARTGPALLRRAGRVASPANLARAQQFTDRFGSLAVLAARWVPWVRTFVPMLAGMTRMPWPRFLAANVAGALGWVPVLVLAGYFAASLPALRHIGLAAVLATAVALLAGVVRYWRAAYRRRAHRDTAHRRDSDESPTVPPKSDPDR